MFENVNFKKLLRHNTVLASHKERVLSAEQVNRLLEYGRNVILFTESAWPRRVERHLSLKNGIEAVEIKIEMLNLAVNQLYRGVS